MKIAVIDDGRAASLVAALTHKATERQVHMLGMLNPPTNTPLLKGKTFADHMTRQQVRARAFKNGMLEVRRRFGVGVTQFNWAENITRRSARRIARAWAKAI